MRTKVTNSSVIKEFTHTKEMVEVLDVTLTSGSSFRYFGVPSSVCQKFRNAKSKGSFFAKNIRDQYAWEEID